MVMALRSPSGMGQVFTLCYRNSRAVFIDEIVEREVVAAFHVCIEGVLQVNVIGRYICDVY